MHSQARRFQVAATMDVEPGPSAPNPNPCGRPGGIRDELCGDRGRADGCRGDALPATPRGGAAEEHRESWAPRQRARAALPAAYRATCFRLPRPRAQAHRRSTGATGTEWMSTSARVFDLEPGCHPGTCHAHAPCRIADRRDHLQLWDTCLAPQWPCATLGGAEHQVRHGPLGGERRRTRRQTRLSSTPPAPRHMARPQAGSDRD